MRDLDIRRALRLEMNQLHNGDFDTLLIEELGLCQGNARVDFAVINGTIHGYEIKSERDTLARLPTQLNTYNRALELITVVAAERHLSALERSIPNWWGLQVVSGDCSRLTIGALRKAQENPNLDSLALAQFLWRNEALQTLMDHGHGSGMLGKTRAELWDRLASEFSINELGLIIRKCLKRRGKAWRPLELQA